MKKILIIIFVAIAAGVGYWLGSPLFLDKKVSESVEDIKMMAQDNTAPVVVAMGSFVDADSFHKGEGTVKLIKTGDKYFIRFEDDFKTTNGPDLFVHFGKDGKYVSEAKIGSLKGNIGGQNYEVPENINPNDYNEIWVWCRAFSVPFTSAILK